MDTSEKEISKSVSCFRSDKMANDSAPPSYFSSNSLDETSIEIE